jgi:hypothetical protein
MIQLPINCILMGLITYFMFEAQINYMWSLKTFEVSEILHVTTFYTICSPSFPLKKLHHNVPSPFVFYQVIFKFLYIQVWYMNEGLDPSYQTNLILKIHILVQHCQLLMLGGPLIFMIFGYSLSNKLEFKEPLFSTFQKNQNTKHSILIL